jgi:hypothetical protein
MKKFVVEYLDGNNFVCSKTIEGISADQVYLNLHKDYGDISIISIKECE